jgi:carboxypeptidase C (cathepsin A)
VNLNLQYLGIGDGLTDPITQYPAYISYAAKNPYYPLVNSSVLKAGNDSYTESGGCKDQIIACNNGGSNSVCSNAQAFCNDNVLGPLAGDYDVYYVLSENPDPYPPNITNYLASITSKVGARTAWKMTNYDVYDNFATTGDWMRTKKPYLESVINAGVRTVLFTGDVDYIVNYQGVEAMIGSLETKFSGAYNSQPFSDYTVNGVKTGQYKNAGTFSYVRIYGAGHEVPAYKYGSLAYGQAAYQFFSQIMSGNGLSST